MERLVQSLCLSLLNIIRLGTLYKCPFFIELILFSIIIDCRFYCHTVLVMWVLLPHFQPTQGQTKWHCKGLETKYTARDCETDREKMVSDLCYFLPHFQQYRPCSAICNDVVFGSIAEDRCKAYCSGMVC